MDQRDLQGQQGNSSAIFMVILIFIGLVAVGTWAAYHYGEANIVIFDRTIDQLEPWEVIGGVIIGITGAILGLVLGVFGLVLGAVVTVASLVLALAGVAAGLFITAGTLLGPFLLLAAIILLLRRSEKEKTEAARAATTPAGAQSTQAMAKYWT